MRSIEPAQGGLIEGIAQFGASIAFNDIHDDQALFRYYKEFEGNPNYLDLEENNNLVSLVPEASGGLGGPRRWMETQCIEDPFGPGMERAVELDYMRFWWQVLRETTSAGQEPNLNQMLAFLAFVRQNEAIDGMMQPLVPPTVWDDDRAWDGICRAAHASNAQVTNDFRATLLDSASANGVTNGVMCPADP